MDRTDWRKMLLNEGEYLDLLNKRDELLNVLQDVEGVQDFPLDRSKFEILKEEKAINIRYPVLFYPRKIKALNIEKHTEIKGTLLGIKGQYLILDIGVVNIRNIGGYVIEFSSD